MRRQLPAYSPLTLGAIGSAALRGFRDREAPVERLADELASRFQARGVVVLGSGTEALQLAIATAAARREDSEPLVALPAYCCYDVATAAVGAGVRVVLYDLDPTSLSPDPASVERALGEGARVVVVANCYGYPVDWGEMRRLCGRWEALVIEDAAQGVGSTWQGRPGGTFGDFTVLSFGRGKGWTGVGGGALLLRGAELPALEGPVDRGWSRLWLALGQWAFGRPSLYAIPAAVPGLKLGETVYREPHTPARMPSFCAALALATEQEALAEIQRRRRVAEALLDVLAPASGAKAGLRPLLPLEGGEASFLRLPVLLPEGGPGSRHADGAMMPKSWASLGIYPGYPRSLAELPALHDLLLDRHTDHPGARELTRRLVTLPTHSLLSGRDFQKLTAALSRGAAFAREAT